VRVWHFGWPSGDSWLEFADCGGYVTDTRSLIELGPKFVSCTKEGRSRGFERRKIVETKLLSAGYDELVPFF
jgi:hypothetical protein